MMLESIVYSVVPYKNVRFGQSSYSIAANAVSQLWNCMLNKLLHIVPWGWHGVCAAAKLYTNSDALNPKT